MQIAEKINEELTNAGIAFFGAGKHIPEVIAQKTKGRLEVFQSKNEGIDGLSKNKIKNLNSLSDISRRGAEVCLLDNEARSVLFAKYPNYAEYVLVSLSFTPLILIVLVGLIRRRWLGMVELKGVTNLKTVTGQSSKWLVLKNHSAQVDSPIYLSLSAEIGIKGFLNFLKENQLQYVVPRFFEKLPEMHRPDGGDLGILVSNEDAVKVRSFLRENPGDIPVDLHTVSGPAPGSGGMPYYPPIQAKSMLENAVEGPAGSRIPNKQDHLHSFVYHILFHKGFFSGVESAEYENVSNKKPENDYGKYAADLANELGIEMELTLEGMEKMLKAAGWVPKLDTLAAIARLNEWVRWHYFASREIVELGLSVLILKKVAQRNNWVEEIEKDLNAQGFEVVLKKTFTDNEVHELSKVLRGGNWYSSTGNSEDYLPYSAYVLKDLKHSSPIKVSPGRKEARIRVLKTYLRNKYSSSLDSFIHATDDTDQSWEYIEDIFPEKKQEIRDALGDVPVSEEKFSLTSMIKIKSHILKERMKAKVLENFD
jgi:hypothetical protein